MMSPLEKIQHHGLVWHLQGKLTMQTTTKSFLFSSDFNFGHQSILHFLSQDNLSVIYKVLEQAFTLLLINMLVT